MSYSVLKRSTLGKVLVQKIENDFWPSKARTYDDDDYYEQKRALIKSANEQTAKKVKNKKV